MSTTSVYQLFDAEDVLLYVGLSNSVAARLSQHRKRQWGHRITRVETQEFSSREEAAKEEERLIQSGSLFNVKGSVNPPPRESFVFFVRHDDPQLHRFVKSFAALEGMSVEKWIEEVVRKEVARKEGLAKR